MALKEFVEENFKVNKNLGYPIKYVPCGIYDNEALLCYIPVQCYLVQEKTSYKNGKVNKSYKVVYPTKINTLGDSRYNVPEFVRGTNNCYNSQVVHDISDNFEEIADCCEKFNHTLLADKKIDYIKTIRDEISSYYDLQVKNIKRLGNSRKRERD